MGIFSRWTKTTPEPTAQVPPPPVTPEISVGPAYEYFFELVMAEIEEARDRGRSVYSLSYHSNLPISRKVQAKFGEEASVNRSAVEKLLLERGLTCTRVNTPSGGYQISLPPRQVDPAEGTAEDALRAREARATQRKASTETEAQILALQLPQLVMEALVALRQHGFPSMTFQTHNKRIVWNGKEEVVAWQLSKQSGGRRQLRRGVLAVGRYARTSGRQLRRVRAV